MAWAFIIVGVIGVFLPFFQGILFIIIGLYLLSIGSPKAHRALQLAYFAFKVRFPRVAFTLVKIEKKWEDMISRWRRHP